MDIGRELRVIMVEAPAWETHPAMLETDPVEAPESGED